MRERNEIQVQVEERAFLIGTHRQGQPRWNSEDLMVELARLAETAGATPVQSHVQSIRTPDPAFFIGSGKVDELAQLCNHEAIDVVIFNDNLSPAQQKNLEQKLNKKVVDRTGLILDIFAQRAFSKEGKLQVELAQLHYLLPRLTRMWTHLSRLGGGIGTRGPGETQLETDKRKLQIRMSKIKKQLKTVSKHRSLLRQSRKGVPLPIIALVGYTNSGKSTLFQSLTGAATFTEDKLFATLDPLIRQFKLNNQYQVLLLDTVGFIRELPTQLVAAFKATIEEIQSADVLLHVIDVAHPLAHEQIKTVERVLSELGLDHLPLIKVFNKVDLIQREQTPPEHLASGVYISALQSQGLEDLKATIHEVILSFREKMHLEIPYTNKSALNFLHRYAQITKTNYGEEKLEVWCEIDRNKATKLNKLVHTHSE